SETPISAAMRRKASRPFFWSASMIARSTASTLRGRLTAPLRAPSRSPRNAQRLDHEGSHCVNGLPTSQRPCPPRSTRFWMRTAPPLHGRRKTGGNPANQRSARVARPPARRGLTGEPGVPPCSPPCSSVDLGHDVLDLRVVLERVRAQVLAVARLLVTAVRHLRDQRDVVVDPDGAELELARRVQRPADVARPDRSGQAVIDAVRPGERLVVVGEALDGHDRLEDLTLDDLVLLADIRNHRRLDEEATVAVRHAPSEHVRALRAVEEAEHALLLRLRDHRSHLD